ncbi:hypothetical protein E3T43_17755 [Cryobacterium sp. Hh7]|uniref:hypothetical protein n=1 Tax=Cryobacterium sp. Hh7 TaxID=1259159 RepID=UPI00106B30CD|nr:hypothetical protein [Cryobacterium sp. Hh7]TFD50686.1 hypothetical protein E3T43_17755 [Cryobacterium sp. Hh7]
MRIDELFDVSYGNKFDFNKMTVERDGICFVGRAGVRRGVSGRVAKVGTVTPYPAGLLTVALGGASRLATFVQSEQFYTAQNVAVLVPKTAMTLEAKLFWATCIQANRFRYEGFGREANRTLATLELPDQVPEGLNASTSVERLTTHLPSLSGITDGTGSPGGLVEDLFTIRYGQSLELNRLVQCLPPLGVNLVSRTDKHNGVSARVVPPHNVDLGKAGELTVALGGSPLATFLQAEPFVCGRDVAILSARQEMSDAEKIYWAMCIRANRYRFSYGRQANRTLAKLQLPPLPAYMASSDNVAAVINAIRDELGIAHGHFASS